MVGAIVSVFVGKADWTQASIAITAGLAAIGLVGKNGDSSGSNSL
ncbi:hypothetical protein LEP1GSC073_2763 [Leptospira noguchii str. Cascata]|nr:hypothetical protein LEP1GSC073_2763 [Leptospira noguchii str. Cascata]